MGYQVNKSVPQKLCSDSVDALSHSPALLPQLVEIITPQNPLESEKNGLTDKLA